jgi:hypothetical protein
MPIRQYQQQLAAGVGSGPPVPANPVTVQDQAPSAPSAPQPEQEPLPSPVLQPIIISQLATTPMMVGLQGHQAGVHPTPQAQMAALQMQMASIGVDPTPQAQMAAMRPGQMAAMQGQMNPMSMAQQAPSHAPASNGGPTGKKACRAK